MKTKVNLTMTLRALNVRMFEQKTYVSSKRNAQLNLSDKTHYVSDDTLRYFHARIVAARDVCDGSLFRIIEAVALDYDNTRRGFRFVVFDVWGTVVERADLKESWSTSRAAEKAFGKWFSTFNVNEHYRIELLSKAYAAKREAQEYGDAAKRLAV